MRTRNIAVVAGLALFSLGLRAQGIFVLPGQLSAGSTVTAFSEGTLAQIGIGTFSAAPGASQVLESADGTKFYVISYPFSGPSNVLRVSTLLSSVQMIGSFQTGASAAILSPDGRNLLVAAGNLQIFNTSTDQQFASVNVGGTAVDVAASIDSTRAFVLVNTNGGYQLTAVSLASQQVIASVGIPAQATGVAQGPNGLIYVTATNQLFEVDPTTLAFRNTIAVNGIPQKISFTPDGKFGLSANSTPTTGSTIMIFDLNAKTLSALISSGTGGIQNATISNLLVVSDSRVLAYSRNAQTLYDVTLNPVSISVFAFTVAGNVAAAAISTDLASANHPVTKYLYTASGNVLSQYDLSANLALGQAVFSGTAGALSVVNSANSTGTPTALITYGDQQTVPLAGTTAPLVVRVVDAQGNPLAGVGVTFSTTAVGVTIQTASTITNDDGLAATTATVPNLAGPVTISFAVTSTLLGGAFTVNVGSNTGGGGTPVGGLTIIAGQGVLIAESTSTASNSNNPTLVVNFADGNGNPIIGATITFALASGSGQLQCAAASVNCVLSGSTMTVQTDVNGLAQADVLAGNVNQNPGAVPGTITASTSSGASVTFFVTSVSLLKTPSVSLVTPQFGSIFSGSVGQTIKGAIQVQIVDGTGHAMPNVSLRIATPPNPKLGPSATCSGIFALTDATGTASCDLVLSGLAGTTVLTAQLGYNYDYGPYNLKVTAGPVAKINILGGNNQSGKPGDLLPAALLVQVTDAFGNPSTNTAVAWTVTSGNVTLSQVSATTDNQGKASARATIGNFSGAAQVQVTAGPASATFTITSTIPISGIQIVAGNNQSASLNAQFTSPLVARVTNAQGAGVQGVQVTFAVTSGSGTLSNPNAATDSSGNASTAITAGGSAGTIIVTASAASFSVTFTLTAIPPGPTNIVFLNGASLQGVNAQQNIVAAGEIVTIQGLGIATGVQGVVLPASIIGPLVYTLAGVAVNFNGIAAPIFSVSNVNGVQQVTVQVPFELAASGSVAVTITTSGGGSAIVNVTLQAFAPGIFQTSAFGLLGQAVAIRSDGSYASPANPALRGEVIIIFVTGMGQTTPPIATNEAGTPGQNVAAQIAVGVNNGGDQIISAQTVVGLVGVYAIAFQIPADTTPGPQQPVGLIVYDAAGNEFLASGAVIPIG